MLQVRKERLKMINFRWHRDSLEDSLATSVSFATDASFTRYITQKCELIHLKVFDEHGNSTIKYGHHFDQRAQVYLKDVFVDNKHVGFIFK